MSAKLEAYRKAEEPLPREYLVWELYAAGMDNLGQRGKPVLQPLPKPGANELLARVDALGLCYSDIKIINLGGDHPRLQGRDLAKEPLVVGHEVSVTLVEIGENLRDRFSPGQRLVVQPDAFQHGKNISFGYHLRGGAAQYTILGETLHSSDMGNYLIPVQPQTGYSEAALTEPWACVERAYHIRSRRRLKSQGLAWFIGLAGADLGNFMLGEDFEERNHPRRILLTEMQGPTASALRRHAEMMGFQVEETVELPRFLMLLEERINLEFDDIVIIGKPRKKLLERLGAFLAKEGHLAIVSPEPPEHKASLDVGRVHYDFLQHIGTSTWVAMDAYRERRSSAITESGAVWFIGAGGPMGQMHLQRLLRRKQVPRVIFVTDTDEGRLDLLRDRFETRAMKAGARFILMNANEVTRQKINQITDGEGFTHVVLLAPKAELVEEAWSYLGDRGMLNIFAGLARGTKATLRPSPICTKNCRIVGSTGSSIEDLRFILSETEAGRLAIDEVVAAVGGINSVQEALNAVAAGTYPGKVVIYPQLDFPLVSLAELKTRYPGVGEKLSEGRFWNRSAEGALLEELLQV